MLTVKTHLAPSSIHGIGLFATEPIPVNSVVWQCAHENTLQHLLNSPYKRSGRYFSFTDNARFINHSELANIALIKDFTEVAQRKINPGEEILENSRLAYDASGYFFQEIIDPDPLVFVDAILQQDLSHALHKDLP